MGTLRGFPFPPAMVRRRQSRRLPTRLGPVRIWLLSLGIVRQRSHPDMLSG
jgi:hypothetical protein